ncbi:MAG: DNA methyltransferase [Cyclobacteriaceae bacterium]
MSKLLSIKETAEILNVNPQTLRRWDKSGKFKSIRNEINNYRVYDETEVFSFAKEQQLAISYSKKWKDISEFNAYYATPLGILYKNDSLELLQAIEENSIDLIFADPPYNIKKAEWDTFVSQKEYVDWSMQWIREAYRLLKPTGSLFICGFSEILADLKWSASHLFKGCKWLIWFYRNKANLGNDWGRSHESILHFRKSKDFKFNVDEVRVPYNEHTLRYPERTQAESSQYSNGSGKKYLWKPNPLGAKPKDVFEIPTLSNGSWEKFPHETQKPTELLRKIILSTTDKKDTILDPFCGSGTTLAVSEAYGREWIGIEKEEKYCSMIKERLNNESHIRRIRSAKDELESQKRRHKLRGK